MCGINGWIAAPGQRANADTVEAMNRGLEHRGPDSGGAVDLGFCAVGMQRLAIVDIASGQQPMQSADSSSTLVYNGELYDAHALRDELRGNGYEFGTRSDTEVLLAALQQWGHAALDRLNGMYGFAFVRKEERRVLLARDPVGIKPLYYWHGPEGQLVFSSELASLIAHPEVPRSLDRDSLAMLFCDRYVADPWTLFEGVRQLPPGHLLRWQDGQIEVRRFASFDAAPQPTEEAAGIEALSRVLDSSVRSQLEADVPVGVFLSGGIDSSTVAAFSARALAESGQRVQTFSVGFSSAEHDESPMARRVADHIGADHHELRVEDEGFDLELLDRIVDHVGQPLADVSCIPTYQVCKAAREEVKVVLSGDGGDELFGGYDHMFWAARVRRTGEQWPGFLRRIGTGLLDVAAPLAPSNLAVKVRRARKGMALTFLSPLEQMRELHSLWSRQEVEGLLADPEPARQLRPLLADDQLPSSDLSPEDWTMALLARTSMPGAILTKVDRMSMATSLEVRVPLLDRRVVELAMRLPLDLKVRGRVGKYVLREAGRPLLPAELYNAPKKGFVGPMDRWFNAEFWSMLDDLYAPGSAAASLFAPGALQRILAEGRGDGPGAARLGSQRAATRVWLLAQLGRWIERLGVRA